MKYEAMVLQVGFTEGVGVLKRDLKEEGWLMRGGWLIHLHGKYPHNFVK